MAGHVFVIRGDIRRIVCDAWLLPTDAVPHVEPGWFRPPGEATPSTLSWLEQLRSAVADATVEPFRPGAPDVRVLATARSASGAVPVLTHTAVATDHVDWGQVRRAL